jgi:hypothetical protein
MMRTEQKEALQAELDEMGSPGITENNAPAARGATERGLPSALSDIRSRKTYFALLTLVAIWAVKLYSTWAAWGNVTIDSGHEMYIPLLLSQGKQLYRDVWFMYGPLAPYFNSYLFRLFGVHLNVLYWAGSLSALGSAVFLYLIGSRLSVGIIGWTAGAIVLLEAFQPSLFCFPLPYSFSAVYACLVGCIFLWTAIHASTSTGWAWMFAAGSLAAISLLLKPEFGLAAYATLLPLILVRSYPNWSWKSIFRDVLAILPGAVFCGAVILWMVSIRGVEFITQENIVSWPTSFFMKNYGKMWLQLNGFTISRAAFAGAISRAIPVAGFALLAYCVLWWKRSGTFVTILKVTLAVVTFLLCAAKYDFSSPFRLGMERVLAIIFFPRDMVLYVMVATLIAWGFFIRPTRAIAARGPEVPLMLTFTSLLSFRILMNMQPGDYSIYYNGPVVLSFLLLACMLIPRSGRSRRFVLLGQFLICFGCFLTVALYSAQAESDAKDYVPLVTERGTVRISPAKINNYGAAIRFMKEKAAAGESVLSVPEDTSLYFFSETYAPTRVFAFTPGVLAPGKMTDELVQEIDRKRVPYLLWSNRLFFEFGVPVFGKDFDREFGDYLRANYHRIGLLTPPTGPCCPWTPMLWERKPEAESK